MGITWKILPVGGPHSFLKDTIIINIDCDVVSTTDTTIIFVAVTAPGYTSGSNDVQQKKAEATETI